MTLQQKINKTEELIKIIDIKLEEANKKSKKLEAKMLLTPSNKENKINYYMAFSVVDKLMDLKLLLLKDLNNTIIKVNMEVR